MSCFLTNVKRAAWPCLSLSCLALGAAMPAHADIFHWSTAQVDIQFDTSSFAFHREAYPGYLEDVSPASLSYTQVGPGVQINFNDLLSLYATSYSNFTPQTLSGDFSAYFSITPKGNYFITGYTVLFSGTYSIETPASVYISSTAAGPYTASSGSGVFNFGADVAGAATPALAGSFSATGDLSTIQVFDGYQQVFDHNESVLDYCETVEPFTCYYRDEPVYVGEPIYHDETDLGEAQFNLQTIRLVANISAVPESDVPAMALGGLPVLAWCMRRRRDAGSLHAHNVNA